MDTTFDPGLGVNVNVVSPNVVAIQQDGRILIGGSFATVENQPRNCIARLLGSPVTWDAFQVWKIGYAINPSVADGSVRGGDGLPVLAEYALGGNPSVVNQAILPLVAMTSQTLSLTYNKLRSDVTYWAEVSTDLVHWTTNGVDQGGSGSRVTASAPVAVGGGNLFIRLHFTRP